MPRHHVNCTPLQACPIVADGVFRVYSLFSAMTVHIFYMRSSDVPTASISKLRSSVCMNALQIASQSWSIARTMHAMFRAVLKKPDLEANLQRVAEQR